MFDTAVCVKYVESLIRNEELERALLVLDNVPARYRDNVPDELKILKGKILSRCMSSYRYVKSVTDDLPSTDVLRSEFKNIGRYREIERTVKEFNEKGVTPHIVDFGPGMYILPFGLSDLGYHFTYWPLGINRRAFDQAKELRIKDHFSEDAGRKNVTLFAAFEVIEHLSDPRELAVEAIRNAGRYPEFVFLSTPYYCFSPIPEGTDWEKCDLEHLRAYTPNEFGRTASEIFPGYRWEGILPQEGYGVMTMTGILNSILNTNDTATK